MTNESAASGVSTNQDLTINNFCLKLDFIGLTWEFLTRWHSLEMKLGCDVSEEATWKFIQYQIIHRFDLLCEEPHVVTSMVSHVRIMWSCILWRTYGTLCVCGCMSDILSEFMFMCGWMHKNLSVNICMLDESCVRCFLLQWDNEYDRTV